jgi:hypothetical protein
MRRLAARLGLGALAVSAALTMAAASAWAASWPTTRWHIAYRSHTRTPSVLIGVTATGPKHAWVLGQTGSTFFVLQWNGRAWDRLKPLPRHLILGAIAASSSADVWVFGSPAGSPGNEAVHWNGTSWATMPMPSGTMSYSVFYAVAASPSDVWAATGSRSMLHWDGSSWQRSHYELPGFNPLATAGGRIWRVDSGRIGGHPGRLMVRTWTGTSWRLVTSPHPGLVPNTSIDISASSPANIWIRVPIRGGHDRAFLLHWDGKAWKRMAEPDLHTSGAMVVAVGRAGAWANGGLARWTGRSWAEWTGQPHVCLAAVGDEMTGVPGTESALCISPLGPAPAEILQAGPLP